MNKRPRILVVDDDHDTLDLLEIILYKKYEIVTASNGFEALAKIKDSTPSLVITDIFMPVMDGIKLLSRLRKDAAMKEIPVVAITSFTEEYPVKSLTGMGFAGVITKPPDTTATLSLISRLLAPGEHA